MSSVSQAGTVAEARAAMVGDVVTIDDVAIVSLTDLVSSSSFISFAVEDASAGITIFGDTAGLSAEIVGLSVGDIVTITGAKDSFAGLDEITWDMTDFALTDSGMNVPVSPTPIATTDLLDMSPTAEGLESRLVSLAGVTFLPGGPADPGLPFAAGNYEVTDGVNTVIARIATSDIAGSLGNVPTGAADLTGVFGQFDFSMDANLGYQIQVTSLVPEPGSLVLVTFALGMLGFLRRRS